MKGVFIRVRADTDGVDFHIGSICPPLLAPSVTSTSTRLLAGRMRRRLSARPMASPIRGVLARDAYFRLVEPDPHGAPVIGQRCLKKGLSAEQDQADPVAFAAFEKVAEQLLNQHQSADFIVFPLHVRVIHRAGHIDRHQQIAPAGRHWQRFAQPLRARAGDQQQQPDQNHRCPLTRWQVVVWRDVRSGLRVH